MVDADATVRSTPSRWPFRFGLMAGLPILAIGVRGAVVNSTDTRPLELARWIIGSAVVHDGIVVPVVAVVAWCARRVVPPWSWPAIRWAIFATAVLVVVSRPFVARYGATAANPTALDRPYGTGVAVAVAATWLVAAGWLIIDGVIHRRHTEAGPSGSSPCP